MMGVYFCWRCMKLLEIDEINVPKEDWQCDCGCRILDEVANFDEFLKQLGYVGANELCDGCRKKIGV